MPVRGVEAACRVDVRCVQGAGVTVHTVGARFDEHRNTSRVWGVDPERTDAALRELARFRKRHPRFVAWLRAGAPPVRSPEEHVERFGCAYRRGELT